MCTRSLGWQRCPPMHAFEPQDGSSARPTRRPRHTARVVPLGALSASDGALPVRAGHGPGQLGCMRPRHGGPGACRMRGGTTHVDARPSHNPRPGVALPHLSGAGRPQMAGEVSFPGRGLPALRWWVGSLASTARGWAGTPTCSLAPAAAVSSHLQQSSQRPGACSSQPASQPDPRVATAAHQLTGRRGTSTRTQHGAKPGCCRKRGLRCLPPCLQRRATKPSTTSPGLCTTLMSMRSRHLPSECLPLRRRAPQQISRGEGPARRDVGWRRREESCAPCKRCTGAAAAAQTVCAAWRAPARCRHYSEVFPASGRDDVALLDICSSWVSHYPEGYTAGRVSGERRARSGAAVSPAASPAPP